MATTFMLQDVLPAGTTFVEAWQWAPGGDVPFPPDSVSGGVVTWNLGLVEPGQWYNINFRVAIDPDLQVDAGDVRRRSVSAADVTAVCDELGLGRLTQARLARVVE